MPIDPEPIWKQQFASLAPDSKMEWPTNIANIVDQRVTNKLQISGITGQVTFTWQKAIFENILKTMAPSPTTASGAQVIASAWQSATAVSTVVVAPGSSVGAPSPPTIFSVVISSLIDPPSIAAGSQIIVAMLTASAPVQNSMDAAIGPAILKAFKLLTVSVIGINSIPPPAGPTPLNAPFLPVL
jgi:hypothetical protein